VKIDHILTPEVFSRVFTEGVKIRGNISAAYILRVPGYQGTTVGVVVSRKCAPRAVRRNYLKRLIYGYFADRAEDISPGRVLVVVRITAGVGDLTKKKVSSALKKDLALFCERAEIG
jgi:ribonuclease P protein component